MAFSRLKEKFRKAVFGLVATAGLCAPFGAAAQQTSAPIKTGQGWTLRFNASHSVATTYFGSDLRVKTPRHDLIIKNNQWVARDGNDWFSPKTWVSPGNSPLKMIDEPANTFGLSAEKGRHVIFVNMFHPKFLQNEKVVRHVKGTIDGVPVDRDMKIEVPESEGGLGIVYNQNTYMSLEYEIGYAYKLTLFNGPKSGVLTYMPGVALGVHTGRTQSGIRNDNDGYDTYREPYSLQGFGGSISNRLEWRTPGGWFGLFYENKVALYQREHALLDGKQSFTLGYMANNVGFSTKLFDQDRRAAKKAASARAKF